MATPPAGPPETHVARGDATEDANVANVKANNAAWMRLDAKASLAFVSDELVAVDFTSVEPHDKKWISWTTWAAGKRALKDPSWKDWNLLGVEDFTIDEGEVSFTQTGDYVHGKVRIPSKKKTLRPTAPRSTSGRTARLCGRGTGRTRWSSTCSSASAPPPRRLPRRRSRSRLSRRAGTHLLADLLEEGLRALAVRLLVVDDLADEARLCPPRSALLLSRTSVARATALARRGPLRLRHGLARPVRGLVVRGLRLRDVVEARRLRAPPASRGSSGTWSSGRTSWRSGGPRRRSSRRPGSVRRSRRGSLARGGLRACPGTRRHFKKREVILGS